MKYRPEIDGLRAVAVTPVIFYHAGFELFGGGYVGVDVFFVISGYLITKLIAEELDQERFSLVDFYERRARRILPALFLVTTVTTPFAYMWMMPSDFVGYAQSVAAVSTFSSNIFFWYQSGYFEPAAELVPLLHTWSLAVEEQFYVLYPVFFLIVSRISPRFALGAVLLVAFISFLLAAWGAIHHPSAAFFLLPTRVWELLVGSMTALLTKPISETFSKGLGNFFCLAGFVLIAFSALTFSEETRVPGPAALAPTIGTALVLCFCRTGMLLTSMLASKPFVGIGLISYSAYLWHQPLFSLARHRALDAPSTSDFLIYILATFVLAYLTWQFVEKPFRRRDTALTRGRLFASSGAAMAILLALGLFKGHDDGVRLETITFDGIEIAVPIEFQGIVKEGRNCSFPDFDLGPCDLKGTANNNLNVVVIGDSHARVLTEPLYRRKNEFAQFWDLSASGCPFLPGMSIYLGQDPHKCDSKYQEKRLEFIDTLAGPTLFVVSSRLPSYYWKRKFENGVVRNGTIIGRELGRPIFASRNPGDSNEQRQSAFERSIQQGIDFLRSRGSVVVVLPTHTNGWDVIERAFRLSNLGYSYEDAEIELSVPRDVVVDWVAPVEAMLRKAGEFFRNVQYVDPKRFTCSQTENMCRALLNYELLFSNPDHLSFYANDLLAEEIFSTFDWTANHLVNGRIATMPASGHLQNY